MKHFFNELFDYSHQCNQNLIELIMKNTGTLPDKVIQLYSHILNAHQIWNNRIDPEQPLFDVWQVHPVTGFVSIESMNYDHSLRLLERCNLDEVVHYKTSKGQALRSSTRDILFHIINHSTYHRAQIATEFRNCGLEPLVTDYIVYKR
ncbi:putative damage-inducible protein DinB [Sphingobacterium allocomposti]|uniref:Putative damage-inducible protein DinB n=1 Tax=Sphingobacterium allocomposti TaxID=415956 RepID=A0A5S5DNA2_9SPHI|nr:DinB family protein [Sphingobacterium composti Yoo et al. 2007 non Ten et al. 2007]TYP97134.1 putative damage-inducible protein DinB [Sphingobacterium composti Yoo et al. 2007 non Ten et al. 2007]